MTQIATSVPLDKILLGITTFIPNMSKNLMLNSIKLHFNNDIDDVMITNHQTSQVNISIKRTFATT